MCHFVFSAISRLYSSEITENYSLPIKVNNNQNSSLDQKANNKFSFICRCIIPWWASCICITTKIIFHYFLTEKKQKEKTQSLITCTLQTILSRATMTWHTFTIWWGIGRLPVSCLLLCRLKENIPKKGEISTQKM